MNCEEYVEIAVRLGRDAEWRHHVGNSLRNRRGRMFEDRGCLQALESFFNQGFGNHFRLRQKQ